MYQLIKLLCLSSLLLALPTWAKPFKPPPGPQVAAKSYILQDFNSGKIILEKNADEPVEPASLTKLMTAYVVFSELKAGRLHLTDKVRISEKAWRMQGSRMYVKIDTEVSVDDLLHGMIIQSGNDASVALAEYIAGSEEAFAGVMNQYAKKLKLTQTSYANSTGMPAQKHLTSARDMASMAFAILRDFPEYYTLYAQKEFSYNNITQNNRNLLLWRDTSVDGMKTGYTKAAGYCLVSSAKRDKMRLISVVMGTSSKKARASESQKILNYGFRFYETHELYAANKPILRQRVWQGEVKEIGLGLSSPLFITIPRGHQQRLKSSVKLKGRLVAPLQKGQYFGTLQVNFNHKLAIKRPLTVLNDVAEGDMLQWTMDYLLLKFE